MGCLSSKLMVSRSLSYRDDFRLVSHSKNRNNDHILALLNKLQNSATTSAAFDIASDDHKDKAVIDHVFELMGSIDLEPERQSKSCQMSPENNLLHELNLRSGSSRRSRSFHTVEEYDELLERIRLSYCTNETVNSEQILDSSGTKNKNNDEDEDDADKNTKEREEENERRWKKVGKRLGSLHVPPPATTVNFRQAISSPGVGSNYVTPKFGSYNMPPAKRIPFRDRGEEKGSDDFGELVAAFEECMLQLQVEEDNLIKQIDEGEPAFLTSNQVG